MNEAETALEALRTLSDLASEVRCHYACALISGSVDNVDYHLQRGDEIIASLASLTLRAMASREAIAEIAAKRKEEGQSSSEH